jgi:succinate dehydrogenase/fumarate reductase-like Fe-S protein
MATVIEFPTQQARGAHLRKLYVSMHNASTQAPHPAIDSILALLEQIKRTNDAISTYREECQAGRTNPT